MGDASVNRIHVPVEVGEFAIPVEVDGADDAAQSAGMGSSNSGMWARRRLPMYSVEMAGRMKMKSLLK